MLNYSTRTCHGTIRDLSNTDWNGRCSGSRYGLLTLLTMICTCCWVISLLFRLKGRYVYQTQNNNKLLQLTSLQISECRPGQFSMFTSERCHHWYDKNLTVFNPAHNLRSEILGCWHLTVELSSVYLGEAGCAKDFLLGYKFWAILVFSPVFWSGSGEWSSNMYFGGALSLRYTSC